MTHTEYMVEALSIPEPTGEVAGGAGLTSSEVCWCANAAETKCPSCAANLCQDCSEKCDGCGQRFCPDCLANFEDLRLCEPELKLAIEDALEEAEVLV